MKQRMSLVLLLLALFMAVFLLSGCGMMRITGVGDLFQQSGPGLSSHKVVRTAQGQIGTRYRMGGSSPSAGFDCSGLIWWSFRQHGITVPRVTTDQINAGSRISRPEPGDILVFRIGGRGTGLHTGLYAGNGQFVHSPSSGKRVRMDKLADDYWQPRLIAIRRIKR